MEEWKPVVGWEGFYEVSSHGRIRSVARLIRQKNRYGVEADFKKVLSYAKMGKPAANGYYYVTLQYKGKKRVYAKVNVLVARAFLGEPNGLVCDHIDRNPLNNRLENLRYISYSDNTRNSDRWDVATNVAFATATPRLISPWRPGIKYNGKKIMLGSYASKDTALWVASFFKRNLWLLK